MTSYTLKSPERVFQVHEKNYKESKKPEGNKPSHTFHFLYLKHYELWFSKGKTQRERSENLFPNLPL